MLQRKKEENNVWGEIKYPTKKHKGRKDFFISACPFNYIAGVIRNMLHRHRRFYPRMTNIIHQFKIFKSKTKNIFYSGINFHGGQRKWCTG
jgi:prolipoprotein diacylglyceryltransferase